MDFQLIINFIRADGSIVVNKNLARNIGIDCAIMYSEIVSKYLYFHERGQLTEDGYFFNTVDNLEFDTCLSSYQQREAIKKLQKYGLIKVDRRGLPAKRYLNNLDEVVRARKFFADCYKKVYKQEYHKHIPRQNKIIDRALDDLFDEDWTEDAVKDMIVDYFNNVDCDHNLMHFCTEGILQNRKYAIY